MGVGEGNVEVVSIQHLFFFGLRTHHQGKALLRLSRYFHSQTLHPVPVPTLGIFTPLLAPALLVLQGLFTPNFWCATGEATLRYGTGKDGSSLRWEGGNATVVSAVFALACSPGSTLVARKDDPLLLRGNTSRPPTRWAPVLFRIISCFSCTTWN